MPLVMATLATGLAKVFRDQPSSGADAASKIAQEYDKYCKGAVAAPGLPIFTGVEKTNFENILAPTLSSPDAGDPNIVAAAFGSAVQAYWMSPPVMFSAGPASGVVTLVSGAMAIVAPLGAALSNTGNTEDVIGQLIATQLDLATKTVLVTYSTPPPPAGPPPPALVL
jgi:hypothetical protein